MRSSASCPDAAFLALFSIAFPFVYVRGPVLSICVEFIGCCHDAVGALAKFNERVFEMMCTPTFCDRPKLTPVTVVTWNIIRHTSRPRYKGTDVVFEIHRHAVVT